MFGAGIWNGVRLFSLSTISSSRTTNDKFFKILKYAKPVTSTNGYQVGDVIPRDLKIPLQAKQVPDYQYEAMYFKRQNRGLFGGVQRKRSKNSSESGNKSLRTHLPNIQKSKLWSETLGRTIQTKVSTKVLKTITKEGGLDNYLTKETPGRVKTLGLKGWGLKYQVLKQREFNELPKLKTETGEVQVYHIHNDGKQIIVGKNKLLKELYPLVRKSSLIKVTPTEFHRNHSYLTIGELVDKLQEHNYDFSSVSI